MSIAFRRKGAGVVGYIAEPAAASRPAVGTGTGPDARRGNGQGRPSRRGGGSYQNATGPALGRMNLHNVYANGQQVAGLDEAGKLDVLSRLTAFSNTDAGKTQIVVQAGDTLRGIAQRIYGNGNLWYVIAEANALEGDDDLVAGASLIAPEVKTSSNDASTFKPYNPSEITGPTSPGLPYIEPPSDSGCGTLGVIIMVVVAIVVSVVTFGAAAPAMTAMLGSTLAGAMAAGAIAGAASALASGAVGSAMGVASFSWRNVAAGAVTGAITAGIGSQFGSVGNALSSGAGGWGKAAALAVANSAAGYVGQKIAGVDASFSWRSIAAGAVGSIASSKLSLEMGFAPSSGTPAGSGDFMSDVGNGMVGGVVGLHTRRAFGFKDDINYGVIAADAFGNAIGNVFNNKLELMRQAKRIDENRGAYQAMAFGGGNGQDDAGLANGGNGTSALGAFERSGLSDSASGFFGSQDQGSAGRASASSIGSNDGLSREQRIARLNQQYESGTPIDGTISEDDLRGLETAFFDQQDNSNTPLLPAVTAWVDPADRAMWQSSQRNPNLSWTNGYGLGTSQGAGWRMQGVQDADNPLPPGLAGKTLPGWTGGLAARTAKPSRAATLSELPAVENLYTPYNGWWETKYRIFASIADDSSNDWSTRLGGVAGGLLTGIPAMADMVIGGVLNAPNHAGIAGQKWAQASLLDGPDATLAHLEGFQAFLLGFQGLGDVATLGQVGAYSRSAGAPAVAATSRGDAANIVANKLTPAQEAAAWQGSELYPGVDRYRNITLKPDTYIVGASPGQGNYYTTISGMVRSELDVVKYYEGVQVAPNLTNPAYDVVRDGLTIYRVTESTPAAFARTFANPQYGAGGLPQIYIPDYSTLQSVEYLPFTNKVPGVKP